MPEATHCNHCGSPLDEWDLNENYTIHTRAGYGSAHDGDEIRLQLCCKCFDALVDGCKLTPVVREIF